MRECFGLLPYDRNALEYAQYHGSLADTDSTFEDLPPIDQSQSQRKLAKLAFLCPRDSTHPSEIGREDCFPHAIRTFQNDVQDRMVKRAIVPIPTQEGDILLAVDCLVLPLLLRGTDQQISETSFLEALRSVERAENVNAWEAQDFDFIGPALFEWTESLSQIRSKAAPWIVDFVLRWHSKYLHRTAIQPA